MESVSLKALIILVTIIFSLIITLNCAVKEYERTKNLFSLETGISVFLLIILFLFIQGSMSIFFGDKDGYF